MTNNDDDGRHQTDGSWTAAAEVTGNLLDILKPFLPESVAEKSTNSSRKSLRELREWLRMELKLQVIATNLKGRDQKRYYYEGHLGEVGVSVSNHGFRVKGIHTALSKFLSLLEIMLGGCKLSAPVTGTGDEGGEGFLSRLKKEIKRLKPSALLLAKGDDDKALLGVWLDGKEGEDGDGIEGEDGRWLDLGCGAAEPMLLATASSVSKAAAAVGNKVFVFQDIERHLKEGRSEIQKFAKDHKGCAIEASIADEMDEGDSAGRGWSILSVAVTPTGTFLFVLVKIDIKSDDGRSTEALNEKKVLIFDLSSWRDTKGNKNGIPTALCCASFPVVGRGESGHIAVSPWGTRFVVATTRKLEVFDRVQDGWCEGTHWDHQAHSGTYDCKHVYFTRDGLDIMVSSEAGRRTILFSRICAKTGERLDVPSQEASHFRSEGMEWMYPVSHTCPYVPLTECPISYDHGRVILVTKNGNDVMMYSTQEPGVARHFERQGNISSVRAAAVIPYNDDKTYFSMRDIYKECKEENGTAGVSGGRQERTAIGKEVHINLGAFGASFLIPSGKTSDASSVEEVYMFYADLGVIVQFFARLFGDVSFQAPPGLQAVFRKDSTQTMVVAHQNLVDFLVFNGVPVELAEALENALENAGGALIENLHTRKEERLVREACLTYLEGLRTRTRTWRQAARWKDCTLRVDVTRNWEMLAKEMQNALAILAKSTGGKLDVCYYDGPCDEFHQIGKDRIAEQGKRELEDFKKEFGDAFKFEREGFFKVIEEVMSYEIQALEEEQSGPASEVHPFPGSQADIQNAASKETTDETTRPDRSAWSKAAEWLAKKVHDEKINGGPVPAEKTEEATLADYITQRAFSEPLKEVRSEPLKEEGMESLKEPLGQIINKMKHYVVFTKGEQKSGECVHVQIGPHAVKGWYMITGTVGEWSAPIAGEAELSSAGEAELTFTSRAVSGPRARSVDTLGTAIGRLQVCEDGTKLQDCNGMEVFAIPS